MNPLSTIRCFLLDMDGTFYISNRLVEGALRFVELLEERGVDFLFLTNNSSRSKQDYATKISALGLAVPEDKIFTSGEATALFLQSRFPDARPYIVGTPSLVEEFRSHGFDPDSERPDLALLGFDTTLTYEKLWKLCDMVRAGLPYIATHPDFNCPIDGGYMPDIGAMIAFVEASTGRRPDHVIGKPNRAIVEAVGRKLDLPLSALAMVGDRLYTDIALGQTASILTVLVLSGETTLADLDASPYKPDLVFPHLGGLADYLAEAGESERT
jgi:HAD superfamily hydrolase (TIGR01450 family)